MNLKGFISTAVCALFMFSGSAVAQDSTEYYPMLHDRFILGVGAFWAAESFKIEVDGSVPSQEFDFYETLRLDDSKTTGS